MLQKSILLAAFSLLITVYCHATQPSTPHPEDLDPSLNKKVEAPAVTPEGKVRIAFAGGSTFSTFDESVTPMRGIGQVMPAFFDSEAAFYNAALSGASTKSFRELGRWEKILSFQPDYVFIHFAHNDQKKDPRRGTDHATTYRDNLRHFIHELRAIGCTPILVTPVARRTFRQDTIRTSLQPWADAMTAVGQEEGVAVIDLHGKSIRLFEALGDEHSAWINCCNETDRTHFSHEGATIMASLIVEELPTKVPTLADWVK